MSKLVQIFNLKNNNLPNILNHKMRTTELEFYVDIKHAFCVDKQKRNHKYFCYTPNNETNQIFVYFSHMGNHPTYSYIHYYTEHMNALWRTFSQSYRAVKVYSPGPRLVRKISRNNISSSSGEALSAPKQSSSGHTSLYEQEE